MEDNTRSMNPRLDLSLGILLTSSPLSRYLVPPQYSSLQRSGLAGADFSTQPIDSVATTGGNSLVIISARLDWRLVTLVFVSFQARRQDLHDPLVVYIRWRLAMTLTQRYRKKVLNAQTLTWCLPRAHWLFQSEQILAMFLLFLPRPPHLFYHRSV